MMSDFDICMIEGNDKTWMDPLYLVGHFCGTSFNILNGIGTSWQESWLWCYYGIDANYRLSLYWIEVLINDHYLDWDKYHAPWRGVFKGKIFMQEGSTADDSSSQSRVMISDPTSFGPLSQLEKWGCTLCLLYQAMQWWCLFLKWDDQLFFYESWFVWCLFQTVFKSVIRSV